MLETYKATGIIYYSSHQIIMETFQPIFKGITVRHRLVGVDLTYEDETTEVYFKTYYDDESEYNLDILFTGPESEFLNIKEQIKNRLLKADILFAISFYVNDNEGNEIEEEFIHPDFAKRYIPPSR